MSVTPVTPAGHSCTRRALLRSRLSLTACCVGALLFLAPALAIGGEPERHPLGPGTRTPAGNGVWQDNWQILGVGDGLPDAAVTVIHQDRDGDIWFGSPRGGLSRYDGQQFVTYSVADGLPTPRDVTDIAEGDDGSLWFAFWANRKTPGVIHLFDGVLTYYLMDDGLPTPHVTALAMAPDGDLWLGGDGPLTRYDGHEFHVYGPEEGWPDLFVHDLLHDGERLWILTEQGLHTFDGELTLIDSLAAGSLDMALDGRGGVWVAGEQLRHIDSDDSVTSYDLGGLSSRLWAVEAAGTDLGGADLWVGSSHGVLRFDGSAFHAVEVWGGGEPHVETIFTDRDGDLWFGTGGWTDQAGGITSGRGVARHRGDEFRSVTMSDGLLRPEVMSIVEDHNGTLWFGSYRGVTWYDGVRFGTLPDVRGNVHAMLVDGSGRLWIPTTDTTCGVYLYEDDRVDCLTEEDGLPGDEVIAIAEDHDGNLWFGTVQGLARYDGKRWKRFGDEYIFGLFVDKQGTVWSAGYEAGAALISRHDDEAIVRFTSEAGVLGRRVHTIAQDSSGTIWVGGEGGLGRFDGERFADVPGPLVVGSLCDASGVMWFATWGGGVVRSDGEVFQSLLSADGLAGDATQELIQTRNGDVWIAVEGGATRYRRRPGTPTIRITNVIADRDVGPVAELELPSSQEYVSFEFHGGSFRTRPGHMLFLYRLVGHHDEWRQTRTKRVTYEGLPRGDYTFEVVAVDRDLNRTAEPARVRLTVTWPYERLGWITALAIALCLVVWQTTRVVRRDRRLAAANVELEATNTELIAANEEITAATANKSQFLRRMSHDLRSPMNAIIGYTRILRRRLSDQIGERDARNLANIETSSHNLLNLINDILDLSRIEAGRIDVNMQPVDVRSLAEECADSLESIVKEDVSLIRELADVGRISSDPDRLRQVLMNLLGNATKFTDEGSIRLSLKRDGDAIEIAVADTGIGIPPEDLPHIFDEFRQVERQGGEGAEGTGLGLAIARKTVELLGGTITASSQVGVGTQFTVRLPT